MRKKNKRKLALAVTALCLLRRSRRKRMHSCWVRSWVTRKERSLSSTLVRELELEDVAEYQAM